MGERVGVPPQGAPSPGGALELLVAAAVMHGITYNGSISAWEKGSQWRSVLELLSVVCAESLQPDVIFSHLLRSALARRKAGGGTPWSCCRPSVLNGCSLMSSSDTCFDQRL